LRHEPAPAIAVPRAVAASSTTCCQRAACAATELPAADCTALHCAATGLLLGCGDACWCHAAAVLLLRLLLLLPLDAKTHGPPQVQ